jgi:aminopeptidase N
VYERRALACRGRRRGSCGRPPNLLVSITTSFRVKGSSMAGTKKLAAALATVVLFATLAAGAAGAAPPAFSPGAPGLGDPYFPLHGNGGYDVRRYRISAVYDDRTDQLAATTWITAVATQDLSRFNLDFAGLRIASLRVDGETARFRRRHGRELVVTPPHGLRDGARFDVVVRYAGRPVTFDIPGIGIPTGVVPTSDGAVVWGEPDVAAAWFPVNDHPRDKARYAIRLTVRDGLEAISNGRLVRIRHRGDWTAWTWREDAPMASYLAVAAIGQFDLRRWTTRSGIRGLDAVAPGVGSSAHAALREQGRIIEFLERRFGPYPFHDAGAIVVPAGMGGAALESQTRPIYDSGWFFDRTSGEFVLVHELAHQWFGDAVSVDTWRYTWLNEGFATYAEWLWSDSKGFGSPKEIFDGLCTIPPGDLFWQLPPGDPGRDGIFDGAVYVRGAMTLQALRERVGDRDFFRILRAWAVRRGGSTGTTAKLLALAEEVSGKEVRRLFDAWLLRPERPRACAGAGGGGAAGTLRVDELPIALRALEARLGGLRY